MLTVLVDGSNVGMASHFVGDKLTSPTGFHTGAIFGTLRTLSALIEKWAPVGTPVKFVVAWDCHRKDSWRRRLFAGYKANRDNQTPEEEEKSKQYYDQLPLLRQALSLLNVDQIRGDDLEADDIAGMMWRQVEVSGTNRLVLVSGDKDWLQLVSNKTLVWQPTKKRLVHPTTFDDCPEVHGAATPDQFLRMLAITGDSGDDVPGAFRVGPVTALKFLNGLLKPSSKAAQTIRDWLDDPDGFRRSMALVNLQLPIIKPGRLTLTRASFDPAGFRSICTDLGFSSITDKFEEWCSTFERLKI